MTLLLDGRGCYRNRSGLVQLVPGMLGLVPDRDPGILYSDIEEPYRHYYCRFSGRYAELLVEKILRDRGTRFFPVDGFERYVERLRPYRSVFRRELPSSMEALAVTVLGILVELSDEHEPAVHPLEDTHAFVTFLQERLSQPSNLQRFAEELHVSRVTLTRRCRRLTGKSVLSLHEELKMSWASALLRTGVFRIGEVGLRLGYADPLYFSRVFKKHYGSSPRAYMEQERRGDERYSSAR